MSQRAKELVQRFNVFNNEMTGFIQNCSDIESIIIESGSEHLANMKTATGK